MSLTYPCMAARSHGTSTTLEVPEANGICGCRTLMMRELLRVRSICIASFDWCVQYRTAIIFMAPVSAFDQVCTM